MVANIFQVLVIAVLAFVLMFGVGFILNMLLKTTWFPIYAYIALIIGLFAYFSWGGGSAITSTEAYGIIDLIAVICGLAGAAVSGWTIRVLRVKGFKMF